MRDLSIQLEDNTLNPYDTPEKINVRDILESDPEQVISSPTECTVDGDQDAREQSHQHQKPPGDKCDVISGKMPWSQIAEILRQHSIPDITDDIVKVEGDIFPCQGGGWGDVYEHKLIDGKKVAIKCLRNFVQSTNTAALCKAAANELYAWSKCRHHNVLELYGLAHFKNQIGMVSPWMSGGNLSDYLQDNRDVDRLDICVQLATGLTYLHNIPMIHGDIKAQNAVVSRVDRSLVVKLTDFGSSIFKGHSLMFSSTQPQLVQANWTAPEILLGKISSPDKKCDVYSLAMTSIEVFTGQIPFHGAFRAVALPFKVGIEGARPDRPIFCIPLTEDGDELWKVITQSWETDPLKRPNADEVRDILKLLELDRQESGAHDH